MKGLISVQLFLFGKDDHLCSKNIQSQSKFSLRCEYPQLHCTALCALHKPAYLTMNCSHCCEQFNMQVSAADLQMCFGRWYEGSYGTMCNRLTWKYLDSLQRMDFISCTKYISGQSIQASEAMAPLICTSVLSSNCVCGLLFMKRETNTLSVLGLLRHLTEWTMHFFSHNSFLLLGDWLILFLAPSALHGIHFSQSVSHFCTF